MKNINLLAISGLVILFSVNLYGCSKAQTDMRTEQNDFEIIQGQYITTEDLQASAQASLEQERIIQDQSFTVELNDWGSVEFVSYKPEHNGNFDDVSFYLVKNDQVIYEFPYYCEDNCTMGYIGLFDGVEAVGFRDCNNDGKNDIIVIIDYVTGAGPQGMLPRPTARIFLAEENGFYVAEDMMTDVADHIAEKDLTINNVYQYILSKAVENSAAKESGTWQDAYKNIIRDIQSNLIDPIDYYSEFGFYGDVYVGVHDFDDNGIPELIIGDGISAAVFTYEDDKAEKVADLSLYETEEWGPINGLHYQDNQLVLESSGSDGSGYICFTYDRGEYLTGFYCDYHPNEYVIDGKQVSGEEFRQQFDLNSLGADSRIEYSRINSENEITLAGHDESIAIDDLDFSLIEW